MRRKGVLLIISIAVVVIAIYAYKEYNRKNPPMALMEADYQEGALQLINAFEADDSAANQKYLGKVIIVDGIVKLVDTSNYVIILGDSNSSSSVRCLLDSASASEAKLLQRGSLVKVKGNCTGFNSDELLGSDVILNRAVIIHIF